MVPQNKSSPHRRDFRLRPRLADSPSRGECCLLPPRSATYTKSRNQGFFLTPPGREASSLPPLSGGLFFPLLVGVATPPTPLVRGAFFLPPSWSGGIVVTPLSRGGRGGCFLNRRMNSSSRKKRPRPLSRFTSRRTLLIRVRSGGGGEPFFRFVRLGQAVYKKSGDCPLFPFPARGLKLIARSGTVCLSRGSNQRAIPILFFIHPAFAPGVR